MRLEILNNGYSLGSQVLFGVIRVVSRRPLPDAAKLVFYRPDFYGGTMKELTQETMRGASKWSVGDRELMAAVISDANACAWCIRAHSATAAGAYQDGPLVADVLADVGTAPIEEPLRATLLMLQKVTRDNTVDSSDMRALLTAGVSRDQIADALAVGFVFNVTNRLADAFGFSMLDAKGFEVGAKYLLARGYR
ncbi:MAG: carboxymuconolactone decarboxylase family protein [Candidatus Dormibacteraceae bacterium]